MSLSTTATTSSDYELLFAIRDGDNYSKRIYCSIQTSNYLRHNHVADWSNLIDLQRLAVARFF